MSPSRSRRAACADASSSSARAFAAFCAFKGGGEPVAFALALMRHLVHTFEIGQEVGCRGFVFSDSDAQPFGFLAEQRRPVLISPRRWRLFAFERHSNRVALCGLILQDLCADCSKAAHPARPLFLVLRELQFAVGGELRGPPQARHKSAAAKPCCSPCRCAATSRTAARWTESRCTSASSLAISVSFKGDAMPKGADALSKAERIRSSRAMSAGLSGGSTKCVNAA